MSNSVLLILQDRLRKRGGHLSAISTSAAIMCEIIDEQNQLHWHDRNLLTEENKRLKERIEKLETKGQTE